MQPVSSNTLKPLCFQRLWSLSYQQSRNAEDRTILSGQTPTLSPLLYVHSMKTHMLKTSCVNAAPSPG